MFKNKTARVTAFIGALGASAALIGTAATTTGAYFTDSKSGNLSGTSGHIAVDRVGSFDLNFDGLMPGTYKDREVTYKTSSTGPEDIWLKFDPTTAGYKAFTGGGSGPNDSGLGRYGHFVVKNNNGGTLFSSWNLRNQPNGESGCADANGSGSNQPATGPNDTQNGYCGVPQYMLVESNVPDGSTKKMTLTFGLTGKASGYEDTQWAAVPFEVVATQPGVRPDALNY